MADLTFRGRRVVRDRALVMAIINRTPDSFYDRGATFDPTTALDAVRRAVADGAEVVDIGGVKAGPGDAVDSAEEVRRTVPFIEAVREAEPDVVISIDTWCGSTPSVTGTWLSSGGAWCFWHRPWTSQTTPPCGSIT